MPDAAREEIARLRAEVKRLRGLLNRGAPDLAALLQRRGFRIYKKEPADDLLVPSSKYRDDYYAMLHKYSFRLFLRDVIKQRGPFFADDVARYASAAVTEEYLGYLLSVKLVRRKAGAYVLARNPVTSFGETLEWYVAELFRREFGSEAAWGVKFRRPHVGGDYDVIAKIGETLLYSEVKSSPPKQIYDGEIAAFLDRVADLAPDMAVFFMDTELRMKDKLVPMFKQELRKRFRKPRRVVRLERELFEIKDRVFLMNAKESVLRNFETVISRYVHQTSGLPSSWNGKTVPRWKIIVEKKNAS
jgi:hypothetical protein